MICEQEHSGAAAEEDGAAALKKRGLEVVDEDPRQHINLVFIGHVDAGKSTLCGSTLYRTGQAHHVRSDGTLMCWWTAYLL